MYAVRPTYDCELVVDWVSQARDGTETVVDRETDVIRQRRVYDLRRVVELSRHRRQQLNLSAKQHYDNAIFKNNSAIFLNDFF